MNQIPNQLTFRQVCDDDVAIWHRAFALASQMSTAERRAAVFTALVCRACVSAFRCTTF